MNFSNILELEQSVLKKNNFQTYRTVRDYSHGQKFKKKSGKQKLSKNAGKSEGKIIKKFRESPEENLQKNPENNNSSKNLRKIQGKKSQKLRNRNCEFFGKKNRQIEMRSAFFSYKVNNFFNFDKNLTKFRNQNIF